MRAGELKLSLMKRRIKGVNAVKRGAGSSSLPFKDFMVAHICTETLP